MQYEWDNVEEKDIEYIACHLSQIPDDRWQITIRCLLAALGRSRYSRFDDLGELGDIERAIDYTSIALNLTPDDLPSFELPDVRLHGVLGVSHRKRFQRLGDMHDLEQAIEHTAIALALTPDRDGKLWIRLADLGASYMHRFTRLGELEDLEEAIEFESRALTFVSNRPHWSRWLADLMEPYRCGFESQGGFNNLKKAIERQSHALSLTPDGHPSLPSQHFLLANSFFLQYLSTDNRSSLHGSLAYFRRAAQSVAGAPRQKFEYASWWARLASVHKSLNCLEAYQVTIDLLPQFIWLGAANSNQRYDVLLAAESLAIEAASAAIRSSNHTLALEWVEQVRCAVWNRSLMVRSPLDQLHSTHPGLATRLQIVATQLHSACLGPQEARALSSGLTAAEQVAREHRRLVREYNDLLSQARILPGFEDFLRPMKANGLMYAARHGPIAVINCLEDRCDALLIIPGQDNIKHIHLAGFDGKTASKIEGLSDTWFDIEPLTTFGIRRSRALSALTALWRDIVKPILDCLGYTNEVSTSSLPHITWCPTGAMTFLPLHAAGDYAVDRPGSRVFDYVISSYTPTLTALLAPTSNKSNSDCRVLEIGGRTLCGHYPLDENAREFTSVQPHWYTQKAPECTQLVGNQATTTAVLDAMERHDWVHLSCQSCQCVKDPTKDGFFLHDGTLDFAAINQRSFKNKGLAFLSACGSTSYYERSHNEAIRLASGMLMVGYSSVISTMWAPINGGKDKSFIADKVYGWLMKEEKVGNGEAGRALHNAVAALRERTGVRAFERWVPYIHIGS